MTKNRTEKSSYPSRYSPDGWVTAAQYIIELVCEQAAKSTNTDLPLRFWKQERWASFFSAQTRTTHRLLKKYDAKVIINVIKSRRVRTLLPKWVETEIQKEQVKFSKLKASLEYEKQSIPPKPKESIIDKPKTRTLSFGKNSFSRLIDLDEA